MDDETGDSLMGGSCLQAGDLLHLVGDSSFVFGRQSPVLGGLMQVHDPEEIVGNAVELGPGAVSNMVHLHSNFLLFSSVKLCCQSMGGP